MNRTDRTQARSHSTRAAIVRAAEAVFAEEGFTAAKLETIAARVGIRRPSIVYHFRDKRELYDAVMGEVFGELLAGIQGAVTSPVPQAQRVEGIVRAWIGAVARRPSLGRILLREVADASRARSPSVLRHVGPVIHAIQDAVREAQRQGVVTPIDPLHFIVTVAGATVFFVSAPQILAPEWPFNPLTDDQIRAHEDAVVRMVRVWLGIGAPSTTPTTGKRMSSGRPSAHPSPATTRAHDGRGSAAAAAARQPWKRRRKSSAHTQR